MDCNSIVPPPLPDDVNAGELTILTTSSSFSSISSLSSRLRRSTPPPAPLSARDEGVVIEAGMTFVLGHKAVRPLPSAHHFRARPAHTMDNTGSSALSNAIKEFLGRTDHVMNEWNRTAVSSSSRQRNAQHKSYSTRSLSEMRFRRTPSFHSVYSGGSRDGSRDGDFDWFDSSKDRSNFGSCHNLNDEVFFRPLPLLPSQVDFIELFSF